MRRTLTPLCCIAFAALGCGASGPAEPPDPRPNVLLITVDTLRADHLGSYGFGLETSPRIDTLAEAGVLFERAVAAGSATRPSHASIFTSRFVRDHAIGYRNGDTRLADEPTLAERFRAGDFATAAFVSNFVLLSNTSLDRGFDVYDDELTAFESNRAIPERAAAATTRRALDWLQEAGDQPFFLWVHLQDPHGPYSPPPPLDSRFEVPAEPGEAELPVQDNELGWGGIPAYQALEGLTRPSQYRSRYAGEVFYADGHVGVLVDAVDAHASGREAVVLLTADHGESFGENDRWFVHYYTTTPDVAHVPMILRAPGIAPGRRSGVVSHVDVMPTLLELAGLEPPEDMAGIALGPLLRAGTPLPERTVYCDAGRELSAYRGDGFLRLLGADAAWQGGEASQQDLVWSRWAWLPNGRVARLRQAGTLPDDVRAYVDRAKPMDFMDLPDDAIEALRALGYVDP